MNVEKPTCNICGMGLFVAGPGGRRTPAGAAPACSACGSLERHRIVRTLFRALPRVATTGSSALQIGPGLGAENGWFAFSHVVPSDELSRFLVQPEFLAHQWDYIFLDQCLELHVDDRGLFNELVRRLSADGILQASFSAPHTRDHSISFEKPKPPYNCFHLYGRDVVDYFDCHALKLHSLIVAEQDPSTDVTDTVFLFFKRTATAFNMFRALSMWSDTWRLSDLFSVGRNLPIEIAGNPSIFSNFSSVTQTNNLPMPNNATEAYALLREELAQWQKLDRPCPFWWRDDDLVTNSPELATMARISRAHDIPCLVAVIPALASEALAGDTKDMATLTFCQHGLEHINHEPAGLPKSEFGSARSVELLEADMIRGASRMRDIFGSRFFPVFVPPWNTFSPSAMPILKKAGLRGLSRYLDQPATSPMPGIRSCDTHVDIIHWTQVPDLQDIPLLIHRLLSILRERRVQQTNDEPIGILTHHRVMRENSWEFMEQLFSLTADFPCVKWLSPQEIFPLALD